MGDGITVETNGLRGVERFLKDLARPDRVPFAAVLAMTRTAQVVKTDLRTAMGTAFDRPTPWTLNSLFVETATKDRPEAAVFFKDRAPNGVPAGKFLRAQILGGQRRLKTFEERIGLDPGYITVPGRWADLDAHGNVSAGQMRALQAQLRLGRTAFLVPAQTRRRGSRRGETYFIVRPGANDAARVNLGLAATRTGANANLPPGIYKTSNEMGGAPLLVLAFVRQYPNSYRVRFDFTALAEASIQRHLPRLLDEAVAQGLARALTAG